ncbi:MAG TPA: tetratricopeptide repeat protein [Stellaceae bacterium]|nr:tetratricopeptide repeat protein [Stellaceae bacterium]
MTADRSSANTQAAAAEALRLGRIAEAETLLTSALAASPDAPELLFLYGTLLARTGKLDQAVGTFERARAGMPDNVTLLNNLGTVLRQLGRHAEAVIHLRHALVLIPKSADTLANIGQALKTLGRADQAAGCANLALKLKPDHAEALHLAGSVLLERGHAKAAAEYFTRAAQLAPERLVYRVSLGLALLTLGDLPAGSAAYEWRWHGPMRLPDLPAPLWDGKPLGQDATLLLWAEESVSELIQFLRFAPELQAHAGRIALCAPAPLVRLAASAPGIDQAIAIGDKLPGFAAHLPLTSLIQRLGVTSDTIPNGIPYLAVDAARAAVFAPALAGPGFKIGLAWSGDRPGPALNDLAPLLDIPNLRFFVLDADTAAIAAGPFAGRVTDLSSCLLDYADAAAAISRLDLVISVDGPIAHLAGALGRPAWVMLPNFAHWRWMTGRTDTPWYPSLLLYRQKGKDWNETVREIADGLAIYGASANLARHEPGNFHAPVTAPAPIVDTARAAAYAPYFQGEGLKVGLALDAHGKPPDLASLAPLLGVPGLRFYALNAETAVQIEHGPFAGWTADLSIAEADPADAGAILSQLDLVIGGANAVALNAAALDVPAWVMQPAGASPLSLPNALVFQQEHEGDWSSVIEQLVYALQIATTPEPVHA